jgi:WD40 repeat protein
MCAPTAEVVFRRIELASIRGLSLMFVGLALLADPSSGHAAEVNSVSTDTLPCKSEVTSVAFLSSTQLVVREAATAPSTDARTLQVLRKFRSPDGIVSVTISPNGVAILTTSRDQTSRIWNLDTGQFEVVHAPPPEPQRNGGERR